MWIYPQTMQVFKLHSEIRAAFPGTSFPSVMSDDDLDAAGVYPVRQVDLEHNPITQSATEAPPAFVGDEWVQQWVVTTLAPEQAATNLASARAAKWEAIKAERDRRKALGVKVGEHWFHSDVDSRIQQVSLYVMGASVPPVPWKTLTTTPPPVFVTMTQGIAAGIFQATAASDTAVFAAAEAHRIAMEASDRPDLYDFGGGWPPSIEDTP